MLSLKKRLNIKYFMVGYLGLMMFFSALYFNDLKLFAAGLIIVIFYSTFDLLWTYARDRVWYLPVSSWISALVLAIVALPKPSLIILIVLPFLAVAIKQLFHFGKNRHIFNPAAAAIAIVAIFMPVVSWWGAAAGRFSFFFIIAAAIIILWRQNRWHVTAPFLISYLFFLSVFYLSNGIMISQLPRLFIFEGLNGVTIFFATVMVIEPITSTFKTKRQEIFYGVLIGGAVVFLTYFSREFNLVNLDPLVYGLLIGNLITSLLFLPAARSLSSSPNANVNQ